MILVMRSRKKTAMAGFSLMVELWLVVLSGFVAMSFANSGH